MTKTDERTELEKARARVFAMGRSYGITCGIQGESSDQAMVEEVWFADDIAAFEEAVRADERGRATSQCTCSEIVREPSA